MNSFNWNSHFTVHHSRSGTHVQPLRIAPVAAPTAVEMVEKEGNSGSSVILLDFVIRTTSRSNIFAIYRLIFRTADSSILDSREILSRPYLILYLAAVPTKLAGAISI